MRSFLLRLYKAADSDTVTDFSAPIWVFMFLLLLGYWNQAVGDLKFTVVQTLGVASGMLVMSWVLVYVLTAIVSMIIQVNLRAIVKKEIQAEIDQEAQFLGEADNLVLQMPNPKQYYALVKPFYYQNFYAWYQASKKRQSFWKIRDQANKPGKSQ